MAVQKTTGTGV